MIGVGLLVEDVGDEVGVVGSGDGIKVCVAVTIWLNSLVEPKPEVALLSMAVVVAEIDLIARLVPEGRVRVASWLLPLVTVAEPRKVWPSP